MPRRGSTHHANTDLRHSAPGARHPILGPNAHLVSYYDNLPGNRTPVMQEKNNTQQNQVQQFKNEDHVKKSNQGEWLCARKRAFQVLVILAGLVNSVKGYACLSDAECQYPGCNDISCSIGPAQCNNGVWDAVCVSTNSLIEFLFESRVFDGSDVLFSVYQVYAACLFASEPE